MSYLSQIGQIPGLHLEADYNKIRIKFAQQLAKEEKNSLEVSNISSRLSKAGNDAISKYETDMQISHDEAVKTYVNNHPEFNDFVNNTLSLSDSVIRQFEDDKNFIKDIDLEWGTIWGKSQFDRDMKANDLYDKISARTGESDVPLFDIPVVGAILKDTVGSQKITASSRLGNIAVKFLQNLSKTAMKHPIATGIILVGSAIAIKILASPMTDPIAKILGTKTDELITNLSKDQTDFLAGLHKEALDTLKEPPSSDRDAKLKAIDSLMTSASVTSTNITKALTDAAHVAGGKPFWWSPFEKPVTIMVYGGVVILGISFLPTIVRGIKGIHTELRKKKTEYPRPQVIQG